MINIRTKGQTGEREIADALNDIVLGICNSNSLAIPDYPSIQRNQNQSAVGGSDLTNPFRLCVEIKRQEQLSVNTWWKQVEAAARQEGGFPVLIYRQNRKPWHVVMPMRPLLPAGEEALTMRAEISFDDFKAWFAQWARVMMLANVKEGGVWW